MTFRSAELNANYITTTKNTACFMYSRSWMWSSFCFFFVFLYFRNQSVSSWDSAFHQLRSVFLIKRERNLPPKRLIWCGASKSVDSFRYRHFEKWASESRNGEFGRHINSREICRRGLINYHDCSAKSGWLLFARPRLSTQRHLFTVHSLRDESSWSQGRMLYNYSSADLVCSIHLSI